MVATGTKKQVKNPFYGFSSAGLKTVTGKLDGALNIANSKVLMPDAIGHFPLQGGVPNLGQNITNKDSLRFQMEILVAAGVED